jgi:hypothetical protein
MTNIEVLKPEKGERERERMRREEKERERKRTREGEKEMYLQCGKSPQVSLDQEVDEAEHEDAVDGVSVCEECRRSCPWEAVWWLTP